MAPNFTAYNSYAPVAAATALLRREPLSFVAYELAVRLEHVEVSLKLAGEPMNSTIANGAFRAANCAFRAIFARTRCPRWSPTCTCTCSTYNTYMYV